jgi:hypothetical protein
MIEQHSIETTRLSRGAALVGSGARVGVNYLKFYARRALSEKTDERALHEENADEVYRLSADSRERLLSWRRCSA